MNKEQVLGIIRHILTAVGVILVYKGIADDGTILAVIGAVTSAVAGIWSLFDKTEANVLERARKIQEKQLK